MLSLMIQAHLFFSYATVESLEPNMQTSCPQNTSPPCPAPNFCCASAGHLMLIWHITVERFSRKSCSRSPWRMENLTRTALLLRWFWSWFSYIWHLFGHLSKYRNKSFSCHLKYSSKYVVYFGKVLEETSMCYTAFSCQMMYIHYYSCSLSMSSYSFLTDVIYDFEALFLAMKVFLSQETCSLVIFLSFGKKQHWDFNRHYYFSYNILIPKRGSVLPVTQKYHIWPVARTIDWRAGILSWCC